ncbi:hypothetical protein [Priestia aryabhattai]
MTKKIKDANEFYNKVNNLIEEVQNKSESETTDLLSGIDLKDSKMVFADASNRVKFFEHNFGISDFSGNYDDENHSKLSARLEENS